jgi:hypothetical protein
MSTRSGTTSQPLTARWPLLASATLGSAVRTKGLERAVRARLSLAARKSLTVEANAIVLQMEESEHERFEAASAKISQVLERMEALPVLPREVEDILSISAQERQRWLKDGRLKSIGTRTVKMRGRTRKVTFHIFDPQESKMYSIATCQACGVSKICRQPPITDVELLTRLPAKGGPTPPQMSTREETGAWMVGMRSLMTVYCAEAVLGSTESSHCKRRG